MSQEAISKASRKEPLVRVVSVIHPFRPDFTGEGEWWLRMASFLREHGVAVEILTSCPGSSPAPEREVIDGVPVHRVHLNGHRPYWARMRAILGTLARRRGEFDVALFHATNNDTVFASCLLGRIFGWKTVHKMTLLGSDDLVSIRRGGKFGWARVAVLRLADGHISLSEALNRTFAQVGLTPRRLLTIPQGVDSKRFRSPLDGEKRDVRRRLGIPEHAPVVLFCGSIMARKGVDILADAWRRISAKRDDAVLLLVGPNHQDGLVGEENEDYARSIERRLSDLVAAGSVRLLGFQRDVAPFYVAADVFVLPSRAEGWASVVNEAMASGLPCVVSSISEEQVRDGEDGFVVRTEDPAQYAERLLRLLDDEACAQRMGERARRRAVEHRDADSSALRLASFLRTIHRVKCGGVPRDQGHTIVAEGVDLRPNAPADLGLPTRIP